MSCNQIDKHVGARVRTGRLLRRIDVADLALTIGVTPDQMRKYEAGVNRVTATRLNQIARALDVNIAYFFEGVLGSSDLEIFPSDAIGRSPDEAGTSMNDDALELIRVFTKISDPNVRRKIIDFAGAFVNCKAVAP